MRYTETQIADIFVTDVGNEQVSEKDFILEMAELNQCQPSEIREILENQDAKAKLEKYKANCAPLPKKRGRKPMTPEQKAEAARKRKEKKMEEKNIPDAVRALVEERIEVLNETIRMHEQMIEKNKAEIEELTAYVS